MAAIVVVGNFAYVPYKYAPNDPKFIVRIRGDSKPYHPAQQVFSYQVRNEDGSPKGEMIHVAVAKLLQQILKDLASYPSKEFAVTPEQAAFVMVNNGIEPGHLRRISKKDIDLPGILLQWDDGMETIIDGNHRYVRRCQLNMKFMRFLVVTEAQIRPCLLDFPDELAPIEARESRNG